eukprot:scaffold266795_cov32-Tisochrysis_lutea.AAC.2
MQNADPGPSPPLLHLSPVTCHLHLHAAACSFTHIPSIFPVAKFSYSVRVAPPCALHTTGLLISY